MARIGKAKSAGIRAEGAVLTDEVAVFTDATGRTVKSSGISITSLGGVYYEETIILSAGQVSSKSIILANTPKNVDSFYMGIAVGYNTVRTIDYNIVGSTLIWTGLRLDQGTKMKIGREISLRYTI